jgi:hypothetical protein
MRKLLLQSIICLSVFAGSTLKAQKNVLKANLLSPIVLTGSFFYERAITEKSSLQLGYFFTGFSISDTKFRGYGITPEYRNYTAGEVLNGFYIAPFLRYQNFSLSEEFKDSEGKNQEATAILTTYGGGLTIGWQWLFGERITTDIFLGPCYNSSNIKLEDNSSTVDFSTDLFIGVGLRAGLTVGIAF